MKPQVNAPVEVIDDYRATRRVTELSEDDEARLKRGLEKLHEAYEILAPLNRVAEWRLEARLLAYSLEEEAGK